MTWADDAAAALDDLGDSPTPVQARAVTDRYPNVDVLAALASRGGGGAAAPTSRGQYATSPTFVSIANGATAPLTWAHISGDELLDLSSPAAPEIVTAGVYAFTVQVSGINLTAGGHFDFLFEVDVTGEDPQFFGFSPLASATITSPSVGFSLTYYVPEAGVCAVSVTNKDGAASRDFSLSLATVQRIS